MPIHVALTFDDPYWAPAYAVMRSIGLFSARRRDIVFHLFYRGLSNEHRNDLLAIEREFGSTLIFYDIESNNTATDIMSRARYNERLSNIVYARLMFEIFIPSSIDRIVYLDCDMMIRRPIEHLYDLDLQGNALAAVADFVGPQIATGRDMIDRRGLFQLSDGYFNAGMLVVDLDKWRQKGVMNLLEAFISDGRLDQIYYDQDFLNLIFRQDWLELDPKWNFFGDKKVLEILNPYLIHYVGNVKPWHLYPKVSFPRMYRYVMTRELYKRYLFYRWKRDWRQAAKEIFHVIKWW